MQFKHGDNSKKRRSPIYSIWANMKTRCTNKKSDAYNRYGAKGIKIYGPWIDYLQFKLWAMNNGYEKGLTLDRINPCGDYEPKNCQWISCSENNKKQWTDRWSKEEYLINKLIQIVNSFEFDDKDEINEKAVEFLKHYAPVRIDKHERI